MSTQLINIILGMKVRQARMAAGMTLSAFAAQCELSPSYVTEIEKGRKYPRADKILRMAEVLQLPYDQLVSIQLEPPLTYLEEILSSNLWREFPFDEFGLEVSDLINILTRVPDKASALLHAVLEVGRRFDLRGEHFLRAALRSYQELHENYFPDIEAAVESFSEQYGLGEMVPVPLAQLKRLTTEEFGIELDEGHLATDVRLKGYRSVFMQGRRPKMLINSELYPNQVKFLLARELGYQFLGLTERAITSPPEKVQSFQQVLNDFRASYFAGALLMPRTMMLADVQAFFNRPVWHPNDLTHFLTKYDVTPEMLLYRISELVPQFFGLKLHFLRVHEQYGQYRLVKQLNMSRVLVPSGIALDEHFCRRWLVVDLLRKLSGQRSQNGQTLKVGAQMSEFLESQERFLCFGFARPLVLSPDVTSSVIVGFRVDSELRDVIRFANDPALTTVIINETCERCPLTSAQCTVRVAPPIVLDQQLLSSERQQALSQLMAQLQT